MNQSHDPKVLEFRMQRLRKAPRNWTFWIAGFTAANGVFLSIKHDMIILAGFVYPFSYSGPMSHYIAALICALIAFAGTKTPSILFLPLGAYVVDALFAAYLQLWSGFAMHMVVLVFVGFTFVGIRSIKASQARNDNASG